jgi:hypothetical protein
MRLTDWQWTHAKFIGLDARRTWVMTRATALQLEGARPV